MFWGSLTSACACAPAYLRTQAVAVLQIKFREMQVQTVTYMEDTNLITLPSLIRQLKPKQCKCTSQNQKIFPWTIVHLFLKLPRAPSPWHDISIAVCSIHKVFIPFEESFSGWSLSCSDKVIVAQWDLHGDRPNTTLAGNHNIYTTVSTHWNAVKMRYDSHLPCPAKTHIYPR